MRCGTPSPLFVGFPVQLSTIPSKQFSTRSPKFLHIHRCSPRGFTGSSPDKMRTAQHGTFEGLLAAFSMSSCPKPPKLGFWMDVDLNLGQVRIAGARGVLHLVSENVGQVVLPAMGQVSGCFSWPREILSLYSFFLGDESPNISLVHLGTNRLNYSSGSNGSMGKAFNSTSGNKPFLSAFPSFQRNSHKHTLFQKTPIYCVVFFWGGGLEQNTVAHRKQMDLDSIRVLSFWDHLRKIEDCQRLNTWFNRQV